MNCNFDKSKAEQSINDILFQLVHTHFLRVHSYLDKISLHPGQGKLLMTLKNMDGASQKEICKKLNVKASTIAVMIKRMEKTEFIQRKDDENDQRVSRIFITQKGLEVCELLEEINKKIEKECFNNFTEEEVKSSKYLLTKMKNNLTYVEMNSKNREEKNNK